VSKAWTPLKKGAEKEKKSSGKAPFNNKKNQSSKSTSQNRVFGSTL
jgi:hypothetical protein